MVDWYYIFSILPLGVYPCSPDIYNVVERLVRCPIVNGYRVIYRLLELTRRTIDHQIYLFLNPPVEPLNLPSALRMIGSAKDMFDPMNQKILRKDLGRKA